MAFHLHLTTETVEHFRYAEANWVSPDTPLRGVVERMQHDRRGSCLVCEGETVLGIITERDVVRLMAARAEMAAPVSKYMTRQPTTARRQQTVGEVIDLMSKGGYRQVPVVDDAGRPVGVLKVSHILGYLVEHFPGIIYNLPPTPHLKMHEREGA